MSEELIMGLFEDLVNAMVSCHAARIIHRDIKPGNGEKHQGLHKLLGLNEEPVLLHTYRAGEYVPDFRRSYSHATLTAYLADFGLSKFSNNGQCSYQSVGTIDRGTEIFMAPVSVHKPSSKLKC